MHMIVKDSLMIIRGKTDEFADYHARFGRGFEALKSKFVEANKFGLFGC